jgi:hypothetical protein
LQTDRSNAKYRGFDRVSPLNHKVVGVELLITIVAIENIWPASLVSAQMLSTRISGGVAGAATF